MASFIYSGKGSKKGSTAQWHNGIRGEDHW